MEEARSGEAAALGQEEQESVWEGMPKAKLEEDWLIGYREDAVRQFVDDWSPAALLQQEQTWLFTARSSHFSSVGLGCVELGVSKIVGPLDHGKLSGALAGVDRLGRASYLNRETVSELVANVPSRIRVKEAAQLEQAIATLAGLQAQNKVTLRRAENDAKTAWSIVLPHNGQADSPEYGLAWLPKAQAEGLLAVDRKHPFLSETHVLVDVLGCKHSIMRRLGFDEAIEDDLRRINNRREYEAAQSAKGQHAGRSL